MPQTTGGITKKTASRITGKKRKIDSISDDIGHSEHSRKRRKCSESKEEYVHPDGTKLNQIERDKMDRLKYEERFLMQQIEVIKRKQREPKKKENVVDYDHLEELIEKWTVAAQDMVHTIIKDCNDPDMKVKKVLDHHRIHPKMVRWNEEDEEFE